MLRFLLIAAVVLLFSASAYKYGGDTAQHEKWFLLNLHQHVWDGEEWGGDRVNYTTVFDLMFNGSYFDYDGVLINDQLPKRAEILQYRGYVTQNYPEKLYLVGGHYHIHWHGEELSISLMVPLANAASLPPEFYECEEITNFTLEEIAAEVHKAGGLMIWDHPFSALDSLSKKELDTLMELFDGIELVSVRGTKGAGSLTREELESYWEKIRPYVLEDKVFPAGVTDYSAYLGMPEKRGAFWMNKDYGTLVKSPSLDEEAIFQALRDKKAVAVLRTMDGELVAYGKPELVREARERFYFGTAR
jgi:hypothetical protein